MDAIIGEIKIFAGNYAPQGWLFCQGQLVSIVEYETLFTVIGTIYGGDDITTFALPDLRGRAPIGMSSNRPLGEVIGTETVTIMAVNLPPHTHTVAAKLRVSSSNADQKDPTGKYWAVTGAADLEYATAPETGIYMAPDAATITLGNNIGTPQASNNMQPYQCLNFIIAMEGIYPAQ